MRIGALLGYEIDMLVTPDPLYKPGLHFEPVFDYEQVLVVHAGHPLAGAAYAKPGQLTDEVLITYPVPTDRLDIYTQFLRPAGMSPRRHQTIETTDIMLQMVASGRGVAALSTTSRRSWNWPDSRRGWAEGAAATVFIYPQGSLMEG